MADSHITVSARAAPTRRRQIRLWITRALALAADALRTRHARASYDDALRNAHLARDIGREVDAPELSRTRYELLHHRTLW